LATSTARAYRAACPNCGAPVEFASAASASAVCSFCKSTLLREGDALRRIGVVSELFDDHSALQLGASGTLQGRSFTLVGRLQYSYEAGTWNEWHALFDNGRSAWLSEDNGAYVLALDAPLPADAPALTAIAAGQRVLADKRVWDVASVVRARLLSAEGELPTPPRLEGEFLVADLRNSQGEVATLDASDPNAVHWSIGRSVLLADLQMQGLKAGGSEKTLKGRALECPSCGASLEPRLGSTQSLACGQCKAVVDISAGAGAELKHYAQNNSGAGGAEPQIALGSTGTLALGGPPEPWQVVGYLERCDIPEDTEDDTTFWREYLLWHETLGFAFLVDSDDGWSWVRPITGAPAVRGEQAQWSGVAYRKQYSYSAKVTWVLGEFYWRVKREERALVTDYIGSGKDVEKRLSREQTGSEVTWSAGATLRAATVADAFKLPASARSAIERDVKPLNTLSKSGASLGSGTVIFVFVLIFVLLSVLESCDDDDCDRVRSTFGAASNEYRQCLAQRGSGSSGRTGGGSYGGWSGGGGHK
jgi:hypothetical protein